MADEIDSTIKVKWYSTIFLLVGTILAVADPVTDILTLREFYLNDHKTWFGVGLVFVILPSLVISCLYYRWHCFQIFFICWCRGIFKADHEAKDAIKEIFSTPDLLFGWNLLALPYKRLQAFILCSRNFKKLWHETLEEECDKKIKNLMYEETWLGMFEVVLESAPQIYNPATSNYFLTGTSFNYPNSFLVCFFLKFGLDRDQRRCVMLLTVGKSINTKYSPRKFITKTFFLITSQLFYLSDR